MSQLHDGMGPTYHRLTNFTIAVDGDRATARSYVHAVSMLRSRTIPPVGLRPSGTTTTNFVRTPDGWRISDGCPRTARTLAGGDLCDRSREADSRDRLRRRSTGGGP